MSLFTFLIANNRRLTKRVIASRTWRKFGFVSDFINSVE